MKSQRSSLVYVPAFMRVFAVFLLLAIVPDLPVANAQSALPQSKNNIAARLVISGPQEAGQTREAALVFEPKPGWHGYWENPGDAGFGMTLEWRLPEGWRAGNPRYPVPETLLIGGLMNHVYNGKYTVLVPLIAGPNAAVLGPAPISVAADWLACTDAICVPENAVLTAAVGNPVDPADVRQFATWQSAIPPRIDRNATFAITGGLLRVAVPLPNSLDVGTPHLFVSNDGLIEYAAPQRFSKVGDLLVAELEASERAAAGPFEAVLAFGDNQGVRISALPGPVPKNGAPLAGTGREAAPLWTLILGALAGGLLLNIMPCVFPILSLKAISLVRAGGDEGAARKDSIAYSAGVVLACLALGGLLLALRAAGQQVGWAYQLQEPGVVAALLMLATAITANFAGLFELPGVQITRSGRPLGAFATGLLAAVVATPCTGPFMAAALGAALLLPAAQAMVLFGMLGLGLALPFLLLGFVPAVRRLLPKPGPWMETFRKLMAIPMGLTALALLWLTWRLGGVPLAGLGVALAGGVIVAFVISDRKRRRGHKTGLGLFLRLSIVAILAMIMLPRAYTLTDQAQPSGLLQEQPYSVAALADARASGAPVFLWFTADWCVTCKVNEAAAIERAATRDAFAKAGVKVLRGDWTRRDPAITEYLESRGAAGVPLYVWISPSGAEEVLPQVLTQATLVNLANRPRREIVPPPKSRPLPPGE
ncbi:protein-disulfide reductase DsbD family protein [Altererythrobacter aquiaggeris]|uniref:protein-disulfide reductase DsbD family protein n=1 Tax=Aestuarierythrobacter aquiaggeris TaxID=1898396 RepID=UPI003018C155